LAPLLQQFEFILNKLILCHKKRNSLPSGMSNKNLSLRGRVYAEVNDVPFEIFLVTIHYLALLWQFVRFWHDFANRWTYLPTYLNLTWHHSDIAL